MHHCAHTPARRQQSMGEQYLSLLVLFALEKLGKQRRASLDGRTLGFILEFVQGFDLHSGQARGVVVVGWGGVG